MDDGIELFEYRGVAENRLGRDRGDQALEFGFSLLTLACLYRDKSIKVKTGPTRWWRR
jgi:hypothetical protein